MSAIVETSCGKLQGTEQRGVFVFRGIPYARPPVGKLRFRAPESVTPWAGVRDATTAGAAAPQNRSLLGPALGFDVGPSSEDCLYLNVWTPSPGGMRRPVLVWIHGGAFVMGTGSQPLYDGAELARRGDVVVVTINYRLGSFGFLRLPDIANGGEAATGNEGLLDQIAALEWVRNEIAAFGGDPERITVFGESAGSISIATLLGTPRAQGLFHRAVLQSGAPNFVASPERAVRVSAGLLAELGLAPNEAARLYDVPPAPILEAQQRLYFSQQPRSRGLVFAPVVDGRLLPRHPFDAIGDGLAQEVAVLVGSNLDEMKLFGLMDPQVREMDEALLVQRCERNIPGTDGNGTSHGRRAVEVYREARATRGEGASPSELWFAIESDRAFRYPAMRLAELQRGYQQRVHTYLFTWPSPFMGGMLGSCHALELPFVFGTFHERTLATFVGEGPSVQRLAHQMQDAWIAFARGGSPGHEHLPPWPAYETQRRATMLLGAECGVEEAPREPERRFWEFWDGKL